MSELINKTDNRATIRWKLLTGASALALIAYAGAANFACAEDSDHPPLWIELGGQMDWVSGTSSNFTAPFMEITPTPGPYANGIFANGQKPPRFAFGLEGKIDFQPENSDWVFSAGLRYGRANSNRHLHNQSAVPNTFYLSYGQAAAPYADVTASSKSSYAILDFSVGKDVGLGLLGRDGSSVVSAGVRFAQFSSHSRSEIYARPWVSAHYYYVASFDGYSMLNSAKRSFRGVGPSISWDSSAALFGSKDRGQIILDWGINGALLFGRQKSRTSHSTSAYHLPGYPYNFYYVQPLYSRHPAPAIRSRSVTVPNIGGFAGISLKWPNAKISMGYRADVFFNAMDTGIDVAKKSNLIFHGPYASISIGLGD